MCCVVLHCVVFCCVCLSLPLSLTPSYRLYVCVLTVKMVYCPSLKNWVLNPEGWGLTAYFNSLFLPFSISICNWYNQKQNKYTNSKQIFFNHFLLEFKTCICNICHFKRNTQKSLILYKVQCSDSTENRTGTL